MILQGFCTVESLNCLISVLFAQGVCCSDCPECVTEDALRVKNETATLIYDFETMFLTVTTSDGLLATKALAILPHLEQRNG